MKLLLENWRQYLNENEENGPGAEVQRIRDAVISGGALQYDDLSQSGLSDSEVFDMAFKLSHLEAEQSMALIDSLGYSPSVTEVITRVVVEILEAEKADLRTEWGHWFRNRRSMASNTSKYSMLSAAMEKNKRKIAQFSNRLGKEAKRK
jgi:hypothetical protein|tara:strand:+ start:2002 stop:2448 length:447 start_codon:yes stop_codon:yes gene_type:complete